MRLGVDDLLHNEISNEEGRIVRIAKIDGRLSYVVLQVTKPFGKEIEALWRPRESREVRERVRKYRTQEASA